MQLAELLENKHKSQSPSESSPPEKDQQTEYSSGTSPPEKDQQIEYSSETSPPEKDQQIEYSSETSPPEKGQQTEYSSETFSICSPFTVRRWSNWRRFTSNTRNSRNYIWPKEERLERLKAEVDLGKTSITPEERQALEKLLLDNADIFFAIDSSGRTEVVQHPI